MMILGLVRNYIPSYQWVVKGGWHIAECVTRSHDVEGMHVGTVAAGRIGFALLRRLKPFDRHLHRVSVLIPHFVLAKIMITVGLMIMHGRMMTSRACR
jgi:phosphoglycerate dehydrogenase-like enzyme